MATNAIGIDVQLPAVPTHGASVSGRITRASDGHPVANAVVQLSHRGNAPGGGIAVTGTQGRYTVSGLTPGKYVIRVWLAPPRSLQIGYYRAGASNHFMTSIAKATTVTVASTNIGGRNVALPKGYTLSGRVTKASGGGPVVRESVTLTSGDNEESVETDANGRHAFGGLSNGSYHLSFDNVETAANVMNGCYRATGSGHFTSNCATASAVVVAGASRAKLNAALPTGLVLKGRVLYADDSPVVGGAVSVSGGPGLGGWRSVTTAGDGRFTMRGLARGSYRVMVANDWDGVTTNIIAGWYSSANGEHWTELMEDATYLALTKASTDLGAIRPPTASAITGTVHDAHGNPIAGVQVGAYDGSGQCRNGYGYTGSSGGFAIYGLPFGSYSLVVRPPSIDVEHPGPAYAYGFYRGGAGGFTADPEQATTLTLAGNAVTGLAITEPTAYSIAGRITGSGGSLLAADVWVASTDAAVARLLAFAHDVAPIDTSAPDGYLISGLPAGSYTIHVQPYPTVFGAPAYVAGWYRQGVAGNYTADPSQATPVSIGP